MSERRVSKASLLSIAAMVVGGLLLVGGGGGSDGQGAPPTTAELAWPATSPTELAGEAPTSSTDSTRAGIAGAHVHDEESETGATYPVRPPESTEALAKTIADPARSDLPGPLFQELAALGVAVLEADVTGRGRERWPGYWPPGPFRPCCAAIKVHAAGARSDAGRPDRAIVRVLWSAERLVGERIRPRETAVPLQLREGTWVPA
ncbi:MAG: hypothetical protein ABR540_18950 [Acidimicrobiales bacterium]